MLNNRPSAIRTWQNKQQNEQQNFQNNFQYRRDQQSTVQQNENYFEFQLVDVDKFLITGPYKAFTEQKKQIIKQFGGKWQPHEKGWLVDFNNKKDIQQKLKEDDKELQIKDIPQIALKSIVPIKDTINIIQGAHTLKLIQYKASTRLKSLNDLPQSILSRLYDFQKTCIEFGLKNMGRILIADEMGVGKTIESLSLSYCYKEEWPLLIICPSSLRLNWKDEALNWIPNIQNDQIQVITKGNQLISDQTLIFIISYDMSLKYLNEFNQLNIKIAIVDEAHYLKNPQAKRTELLTPLLCRCNHIFLLTGTPAFAKPKELFSLVSIIRPDIFYSFREYGARYCDPKPSRFHKGTDYEGSSNSNELFFILKKNIMIRRLKRDVLQELPAKRRQRITIPSESKYVKEITGILNRCGQNNMDGLFNQMMQQAIISRKQNQNGKEQIETEVEFQPKEDQMRIFEAFNQCYILTGKAKIKGIQEYISELMENDIKFIIFAHHIEILDELEQFVQNKKVQSIRIDGSIAHEKRHERIKQFQQNSMVKVAIIALTSGGVGINLTACSNIIFAEMHWTPAVMLQAEDRAHRIGQESCVNCHYLIGENTLDEKLFSKLESKFRVVSNFLDGSFRELDAEQLYNQMGNVEKQTNEISKKIDNQKQKIKQKRLEKIEKQNLKEQKKNTIGMKSIEKYFQLNPKPQKNIKIADSEDNEIEYMNQNIYLNETPVKNVQKQYQQIENLNNSDNQSDEIDNILEIMRQQEKQQLEQIEERKIQNNQEFHKFNDQNPVQQMMNQKNQDDIYMQNIQKNKKNIEINQQQLEKNNQQNQQNLIEKRNNKNNDQDILQENSINKKNHSNIIINNNKIKQTKTIDTINQQNNINNINNDKIKQIKPINIINQQNQSKKQQNKQQLYIQNRNQNFKINQKQINYNKKKDCIVIDDDQMSSDSISKQEQYINIDNNKVKSVHLQQGLKAYITQRGERIIVSDSEDDIINISDDMMKKRKLNDQNQLKIKQY